jgi:hypothetical protein
VLPLILQRFSQLDTWVRVDSAETISISTGKVELGQGPFTAPARNAAEELVVSPERIRMVTADTADGLNESFTAGSLSEIEQVLTAHIVLQVCVVLRKSLVPDLLRGRTAASTRRSLLPIGRVDPGSGFEHRFIRQETDQRGLDLHQFDGRRGTKWYLPSDEGPPRLRAYERRSASCRDKKAHYPLVIP